MGDAADDIRREVAIKTECQPCPKCGGYEINRYVHEVNLEPDVCVMKSDRDLHPMFGGGYVEREYIDTDHEHDEYFCADRNCAVGLDFDEGHNFIVKEKKDA